MNEKIYKIVDGVQIELVGEELQQYYSQVEEQSKKIEEWEKTAWYRNRAAYYPSVGEQLDALFHAGVFPEEMAAKIQAIKDKYPKPESV